MPLPEIIAVVSIVLVILAHLVVSLRFLFRMEGQLGSLTSAVARLERDDGARAGQISGVSKQVVVVQESIRGIERRLERLESRDDATRN